MGYKTVNGVEVIELGESIISVAWLKSRTEAQAVSMRSDKNQTRNAWKIAHGLKDPNFMKEVKDDKPKRPRKKKESED